MIKFTRGNKVELVLQVPNDYAKSTLVSSQATWRHTTASEKWWCEYYITDIIRRHTSFSDKKGNTFTLPSSFALFIQAKRTDLILKGCRQKFHLFWLSKLDSDGIGSLSTLSGCCNRRRYCVRKQDGMRMRWAAEQDHPVSPPTHTPGQETHTFLIYTNHFTSHPFKTKEPTLTVILRGSRYRHSPWCFI